MNDNWTLHTNVYGRKAAIALRAALAHAKMPMIALNINRTYASAKDIVPFNAFGVPKDIKAVRMQDEEIVIGNWWDDYHWVKGYAVTKVYLRKQVKDLIAWLQSVPWHFADDDPFILGSALILNEKGEEVPLSALFEFKRPYTGKELVAPYAKYGRNDYHSTTCFPYEHDIITEDDYLTVGYLKQVLAELLHPTYEGRNDDPMRQMWITSLHQQFIDGWPYHHRDDRAMWQSLGKGYVLRVLIEIHADEERNVLRQPIDKIAEAYLAAVKHTIISQRLDEESYTTLEKFVRGEKFQKMIEAIEEMRKHPEDFMDAYRI